MKIDAEIRHVTKPGANLFLELGFSAEEARRLQAASRKLPQAEHGEIVDLRRSPDRSDGSMEIGSLGQSSAGNMQRHLLRAR